MATKKKVIQGGLDVQKSDGTSALTVDESTGAATIGPSGGAAHTINSAGVTQTSSSVAATVFSLANTSTNGRTWSFYSTGQSASEGAGNLLFLSGGVGVVGSASGAGAWTFGTSSGTTTVQHSSYGYANGGPSYNIINRHAGNGSAALSCQVAANTNTTAQVLQYFTINAGATGSGQINANGASACAFGTFSDRRLKENITPLTGDLQKILSLNPVEFDYKSGGHQTGFIAQEMEQVYPDAVSYIGEETDEMKTITGWDKTTARLVKAIQELSAQVEELKAEVAALKGQ